MKQNNNILICGLGAIGGYYASRFWGNNYNLKILTDSERYKKYNDCPRIINNKKYNFEYILPDDTGFKADLIIIATKSNGLTQAIENIKNFVSESTIILSFLNGVTSEKQIIETYGNKVLYSFLIGHTFFRNGNNITHDGQAKIFLGSTKKDDIRVEYVKNILDDINVRYEIKDDILKAQWQKYCFNCCVNQVSAITRKTFSEMQQSDECMNLMKNICKEVEEIAIAEGIKKPDFYDHIPMGLDLMVPNGKTSMLQDIEANRETEIDLFGETITRLGEKHNINIIYNKIITEIIKSIN